MIRAGIIGLPNAGKSTTFNAISGATATVAPYPFSTIDPNRAVINLRDPDLEEFAASVHARDIQYSNLELMDIAGLIKGASNGEGLGNEFLGQMKDCDAIVHVVRVTGDTSISVIQDNIEIVRQEIAYFDHRLLRRPFEKFRRLSRLYKKNKDYQSLNEMYTDMFYKTREGQPITQVASPEQLEALRKDDFGLISLKPSILIANVDSSDEAKSLTAKLNTDFVFNAYELLEISPLSIEDQVELGFSGAEPKLALEGLTRVLLTAVSMKQVYTVGHLGVGQWIVPDLSTAEYCSGLLHEALEERVKTVKVAQLQNFIEYKSWSNLARHGLVKTYGASKYIPKNKEILFFE